MQGQAQKPRLNETHKRGELWFDRAYSELVELLTTDKIHSIVDREQPELILQ